MKSKTTKTATTAKRKTTTKTKTTVKAGTKPTTKTAKTVAKERSTIYVYTEKKLDKWVTDMAKEHKLSKSEFVNSMIRDIFHRKAAFRPKTAAHYAAK